MKKLILIVLIIFLIILSACSMNFIKKRLPAPHRIPGGGILFQFEAPSARTVTLSGSFPDNMWSGTATSSGSFNENIDKMYDDGTHGDRIEEDGIWSIVKQLSPGRYEYKYVLDRNTWVKDPNAFEVIDDGYGGSNSVLIIN